MFLRLFWNSKTRSVVLWILRLLPLRQCRAIFISWNGVSYNCNPKTIAEKLVEDNKWDVIYAFQDPCKYYGLIKKGIKAIEIGSFKYYYLIATSKFIISNTRFTGDFWPYKKNGQKYIFTNHGGFGIKKVEFDAEDGLSSKYLEMAEDDSQRMDLTLSNSKYQSKNIRTAYHYNGEILEAGLPRNDFFVSHQHNRISSEKYLLYAPTFRSANNLDVYLFRDYEAIEHVVKSLEERFGGKWFIRISCHPNMRSIYKHIYEFGHPRMLDVGDVDDFHSLLLDSDVLVTDYSSAAMDFMLLKRPVFQFIADLEKYDRGLYVSPLSMPFPFSATLDDFISQILKFDESRYLADLKRFSEDFLHIVESGHATDAVVTWMEEHR